MKQTFAIAIGGAAGQGVATPGDIFAKLFSRRGLHLMGIGFPSLEEVLREQFKKKGEAVVAENIGVARAGYDYAAAHFSCFANPIPKTENRYAILSGNVAMAMGGAAAGVKFYCAYPMSPSTVVL